MVKTNNLNYAASIENLSQCKSQLGNYDDALALAQEAYNIRRNLLGENHLLCAKSLETLSQINILKGDFINAIKNATAASSIYKSGDNNTDYARLQNTIAVFVHSKAITSRQSCRATML